MNYDLYQRLKDNPASFDDESLREIQAVYMHFEKPRGRNAKILPLIGLILDQRSLSPSTDTRKNGHSSETYANTHR